MAKAKMHYLITQKQDPQAAYVEKVQTAKREGVSLTNVWVIQDEDGNLHLCRNGSDYTANHPTNGTPLIFKNRENLANVAPALVNVGIVIPPSFLFS